MGNYFSLAENPSQFRVLSYNVEWGFLKLPDDITEDSCGHKIPHTLKAQQEHLRLISKNIGLLTPDICFLQEIGSLEALQFIQDSLLAMFNQKYSIYYSNKQETGNQGVGLLVNSDLDQMSKVENIPNFRLNRALGLTLTLNNVEYKFIGVHLKSLYDGNYKRDVAIQMSEIDAVLNWLGKSENVVFCGDFNNVPDSQPIKELLNKEWINILDTDKYVGNITGSKSTEFSKSQQHPNSIIDYMLVKNTDNLLSSHIINYQRITKKVDDSLRSENSDHLPVLGIFKY
tara:strand:+ start:743 stop:1600 length:858 start_codon:yes stop_codon:yes gene_type:complete